MAATDRLEPDLTPARLFEPCLVPRMLVAAGVRLVAVVLHPRGPIRTATSDAIQWTFAAAVPARPR